jgi:uracil-DNA glycosylase
MPKLEGIVLLGKIAFDQILKIYRQKGVELPVLKFGHGAFYQIGEHLPWLLASYHPSRQNTRTGRLTEEMFNRIWEQVWMLLEGNNPI